MFAQIFAQTRQTKPSQTFRRTLVRWLILALLLSQGMRVYFHAQDALLQQADSSAVAFIHLESSASHEDKDEAAASHAHMLLLSLFKHFFDEVVGVLFLSLLIVLLPPVGRDWFSNAGSVRSRSLCGYYFIPPLRAPPR